MNSVKLFSMHKFSLMAFDLLLISSTLGAFDHSPSTSEKPSYTLAAQIRIASSQQEREKGLMGISHLDPNEGLLMVFPSECPVVIWAMGTLIDLDVAFIDRAKRVLAIESLPATPALWQQEPIDRETLRKKALHSPHACLYVLEMPKGWFSRHAIDPGDQLLWQDIDAIEAIYHHPK